MTPAAIPSTLRRLRNMDAAEIRFRASVALRTAVDRARASMSPPAWDRAALELTGAGLEPAREALERKNWMGAHHALAQYFQRRESCFPLSPRRSVQVARNVGERFPDIDVRTRADAVVAGRYDLLGYHDIRVGSPPDWHRDPVNERRAPLWFWDAVPYLDPAYGDHKVTWELNRHQHFLVLGRAYQLSGDVKYYREFVRQLAHWIEANPPLQGVNWASMLEIALRSLSWLWAVHFFAAAAGEHDEHPWLVDLLLAMDRQLLHVEHNLSRYFSPNTHLSGEALALYVAGCVLPELPSATRRTEIGRSVLVAEATRQVNADGGHAERSAHYHRYSTDFYLLALNVARLTNDPAARVFEEAARRQAVYLRTLATDDGRLPLLGDDDGGQLFPICGRPPADCRDSLAHAAVLLADASLCLGEVPEETYWFCGNHTDVGRYAGTKTCWASRHFESTGYCVSRNDRGDHLVFDCGPHGFLNGGHAHSDALSIVLTVAGRPLLVDPGTATYTMDAATRDRFRSTPMHNTVVIDGRSQSQPRGAFHWSSVTDAQCIAWASRPGLDYAEATHEGYEGITHRRRVLALHGTGWIVVDHIHGRRPRAELTAMWHFHPAWRLSRADDRRFELVGEDGTTLALASTAALSEVRGPLAAYAPVYGRIEPAPCLAGREAAALPLSILTFIPATSAWHPDAIDKAGDDTFEISTPSGRLAITSNIDREPVINIKPTLAASLHPAT